MLNILHNHISSVVNRIYIFFKLRFDNNIIALFHQVSTLGVIELTILSFELHTCIMYID